VFIVQPDIHFPDLFFSNSFCCEWRPSVTKFGADCTCNHTSWPLFRFQSHNDAWGLW